MHMLCSVHQYALGSVVPGPTSFWDTQQQSMQHGRLSKPPVYRCQFLPVSLLAYRHNSVISQLFAHPLDSFV